MKKIDLGQAIAIVANVGVLAGIVFLAVEIRQVGQQLIQDRDIAAIDRRTTRADSNKYWAELIAENAVVWTKGLSGEPLSAADAATFHALATAWQFDVFQNWANSQVDAFGTAEVQIPGLTQSFIRAAALEIQSNPGLRRWNGDFHDWLRQIGRFSEFNELIEAEVSRLDEEAQ